MNKKFSGITELDVPDNASIRGCPIIEAGYNHNIDSVYSIIGGNDFPEGWNQFVFSARIENGNIVVEDRVPEIVTPGGATEQNTPGANEAEKIYDILQANGIDPSEIE